MGQVALESLELWELGAGFGTEPSLRIPRVRVLEPFTLEDLVI